MFEQLPSQPHFPTLEETVLEFWKKQGIYEKSLEQCADGQRFVFYEGPPTANGMPHPGHCLTRAIKDVFPRYRTMRGDYCERKGGWDTHGLPVEVEVCKEIGIHSKEEIEEFGIEPFIQKCQQSVWRYMQEWERLTERLGFWIHLDEAYVTYHQSYVESVWWSLKNLFDRDLLYQGYKIVWWWAQGGTALSSGEVGQGYREVADPSVFVRFPLLDEPETSLLVWTTTPWTLPSNQFAAVHPELEYATVEDIENGERLIMAAALVETLSAKSKRELKTIQTCRGEQLLGKRYRPPFDYYYSSQSDQTGRLRGGETVARAWRVVAADFVTTEDGSGVVHQAPAFGEVDFDVLIREQAAFESGEGPELICAVGPDGKFTSDAPEYQGRFVKEADKDITRSMRDRGLLFHQEQYLHKYPFCWRAEDDPLIQYPRRSWFIRTTQFKDRMVQNNQQINWLPEHIRDGRFGNFLETNVDWALSRERYWGTPLPIWVCEETGRKEAIGSYAELLAKPGCAGTEVWDQAKASQPDLCEDLKVHKPYIDEVTYDSPFADGARMRRVTEVIDCWYDSGAMPFAQWGYPHQGQKEFQSQFPADFISEALDQTRGWFYSLLAISTLLYSEQDETRSDDSTTGQAYPHPYRNCIVLGLMMGEDGKKMSKRDRNYREPKEIFDRFGADALRWFFFAVQPPWTTIQYKEKAIKDSIPEFLLTLWNCFSFFNTYANADEFNPASQVAAAVGQLKPEDLAGGLGRRAISERAEIDRWLVSELQKTVSVVTDRMDAYDNYTACQAILRFVDGLSNWYVRRSRPRFWDRDKSSQEKLDAYWTLYECLLTTSKLIAPFTPFLAETMWQNLSGVFETAAASVHLCDYPQPSPSWIDEQLSERMELLREIASRGRRARTEARLKVRQPLRRVDVVLGNMQHHEAWLKDHDELLRDELNVKEVAYTSDATEYVSFELIPNFKVLGPRFGKLMPGIKKALAQAETLPLLQQLDEHNELRLNVDGTEVVIDGEDVERRLLASPGYAAVGRDKSGSDTIVVLATELTADLIREGYARDVVRFIQERRKQLDCDYQAEIVVGVVVGDDEVLKALHEHRQYIAQETLCSDLVFEELNGVEAVEHQIADGLLQIFVQT